MKRIYSILFASFSLLSWTSCSSYLEENPKDRLDEETAYSTLSDVQKMGCFRCIITWVDMSIVRAFRGQVGVSMI